MHEFFPFNSAMSLLQSPVNVQPGTDYGIEPFAGENGCPRLKVLLVVPRLNLGGAESYVVTIARQLRLRGFSVVLASGGGMLAAKLAAEGFHHYLVPMRASVELSAYLIRRIVRVEGIDFIHANSAAAGEAVALACTRTPRPWVLTSHGLNINKRYHCTAGRVICVSRFVERTLRPEYLLRDDQWTTVYNGIDLRAYLPTTTPKSLRRNWGIDDQAFILGISSRLNTRLFLRNDKGHHDLFSLLASYAPAANWQLVVAGDGSGLRRARAAARRLGIQSRVHFLGYLHDMPSMLNSIDVLALPSRFETFGLTLIEAMAMHKPVVTYAVGGTPEVVDDGITGYLAPLGDVPFFADRLQILAENPVLARRMGDAGRARVEELFDIEQMMTSLLEIYRQVLAEYYRGKVLV